MARRRKVYGRALTRPQHHQSGQSLATLLFLPFGIVWLGLTLVDLVRALFAHASGEPWTIEARLDASKEELLTWRVVGWSESRRAIEETVEALAQGHELTSFGEPERRVLGR
jgi:hypothetical protein